MTKLFELKRWLTLPEAARHLGAILDEDVSEMDVFRLALDSKLTLSVVFVGHAWASNCELIDESKVKIDYLSISKEDNIIFDNKGYMRRAQEKVFPLEEDWPYDLPMIGGERRDIEHKYWELAGGPRVATTYISQTYVAEGPKIFQLKSKVPSPKENEDPAKFVPIDGLPATTAIVVTPKALLKFETSLRSTKEEKSLATNERNSLLSLIAALCDYSAFDINARGTATQLAKLTQEFGAAIGDDTIRKILRQIADALAARKK